MARPNQHGGAQPQLPEDLRRSLARFGIVAAACLLVASTLPQPAVLAGFSAMMTLAALFSVGLALILGERASLETVNRWDEAALFLLASLAARWGVDLEALQQAAQSGGL